MKTPEEILGKKTGLTLDEDSYLIQTHLEYVISAMEEYANQFKQPAPVSPALKEMPSDEEIEKMANEKANESVSDANHCYECIFNWINGAKWVRDNFDACQQTTLSPELREWIKNQLQESIDNDKEELSKPEGARKWPFFDYEFQKSIKQCEGFLSQLKSLPTNSKWISVEDKPLFYLNDAGNWYCTEEGDGEFIAAIPYEDKRRPNEKLWWIRHCVVVDEVGLSVVTDDDTEPAGWGLKDVTHYQLLPEPPPNTNNKS